jgi:histidinol phosphatase-like enzyme (inositol monophosphatase family)
MRPSDLSSRLDLALVAAREAGEITLRYFQRDNFEIELKKDASPVTIADRTAEEHLRKRISEAFPADGILGEEFPERPGVSGFRWILDPIDGTKSFVHGVPLYGTLVGVEHETRSLVGVIELPALDERVYAAVGGGAWYVRGGSQPRPARVSSCARLSNALVSSSAIEGFAKGKRLEAFLAISAAARLTRTWGDCYGYALIATGRAEVMIDPAMNVWDAAALQPILEEAGGTYTDWNGTPTIHGGEGIATNGRVLDEVLAFTRGK